MSKTTINNAKEIRKKTREIKKSLSNSKYDAYDLRFMNSLSAAVLAKTPRASRRILWLIIISIIWLIAWASWANIDEITRGEGKIIPSGQNQVVQNLEGGIISEILVKEGDLVEKGQILLKIDNKGFLSSFEESQLRLVELKARYIRLEAEASGKPLKINAIKGKEIANQMKFEESLYRTNQEELKEKINIFTEQLNQRNNDLNELLAKIRQLKSSYDLMSKELKITEPLFRKGTVSEVEYLQLQREVNNLKGELDIANLSIGRIKSTIQEAKKKISEVRLSFKNQAKKEFNEIAAEIARISETQVGLEDKVKRTLVRAPVNGVVNNMSINTISGVVRPGMELMEIVPLEDILVAEIKIKPSDIAFLKPGLRAIVKFTAYDFSIHGGLEGQLESISPDTITNEKGESYYLVTVRTKKNYLGAEDRPLRIKVGMIVSADIITGKKTVLDFILKPILKTKQNALRER